MDSWTNATTGDQPAAALPQTTTTAGILRPELVGQTFSLQRYPCDPRLEPYLEHYWAVEWRLAGKRVQQSDVLSHPAVHLTIEEGSTGRYGLVLPAALVHGVPTRRFEIGLSGSGRVLGAKFRPGGFAALAGVSVQGLTDRVLPVEALWPEGAALTGDVLAVEADAGRCAVLDAFLLSRLPRPDPRYPLVLAIVADALADRSATTVEEVARRHNISVRTLQRLARRYIGVGAKWLIRRFRLHDAVVDLQANPDRDLAALAQDLGWYDQAHFTRDFTAAVGTSPARYARGLA
ncbi:AraC family transcriptional regulator [Pseudarthrobacter sp. P1]|uniref:AraC family transcriptional regulator n=1 Tax=Pseudarthrobacter sp. P1 TaxID=3418418 RepID=UPI003CEC3E26